MNVLNVLNRLPVSVEIICREPYRLFFPLGIVMGTIGVGHWLFYSLGWANTYSGFFHSSVQMLLFMNCFVSGFILTFIPRFTGTHNATFEELSSFLLIFLGILILLDLKFWIWAELCYIVWLILLVRFVVIRIKQRKVRDGDRHPPAELIWIPIAVFHGILGTLLVILSQIHFLPSWVIQIGKPMMDQGFILAMVVGVGGFLIPRIMGTFNREELVSNRLLYFHAMNGVGLFLSFVLQGISYENWGHGIRAFVITAEFLRLKVLPQPPRAKELYVRLIWLSTWMVPLGFWLAAFLPKYHVVMLHISFIGGLSLMVLTIATMVALSHAGKASLLQSSLWILKWIVLGLTLAVVKRTILVFFPDAYFKFLGLSAGLWLLASLGWLVFILPYLFVVPEEDEFEKMHEHIQRRVC